MAAPVGQLTIKFNSIKFNSLGLLVTFLLKKVHSFKQACVIAFTSEFIPREVYRFNHGDGTLDGYIDFSLSQFNVSDFEEINGRVSKPDDESHPLYSNQIVQMCR